MSDSYDLISLANEVANEKENIRQAIITAGVACPEDTPLAQYATKISQIQDRVTDAGTEIFYKGSDNSLTQETTTYTVPTTYASIAPSGLSGYANLQTVTMQNVTSVMDSAFVGNKNLTTINAPLCKYYGANSLADTGLTGAYTNNVAEFFDTGCFQNNTKITSFDLVNAKYIGASCFEGCNKVTTINIPKAVSLGNRCFMNFANNVYDGSATLQKWSLSAPLVKSVGCEVANGNSALNNFELPNAETIGRYAFYDCVNLSSINLPSVKSVDECAFAFYNAKTCDDVYLPACENLGYRALQNRWFKKLTVKDGCYIGSQAYSTTSPGSRPLEQIIGKPSYVGAYAFHYCEALTDVDLSACTFIDDYAFNYSSLHVIDLSSCTQINDHAFNELGYAQAKIWLPSTCVTLKNRAIYSSSNNSIRVYTDVANASSRPASWSNVSNVTWVYGSSHEDFLAA